MGRYCTRAGRCLRLKWRRSSDCNQGQARPHLLRTVRPITDQRGRRNSEQYEIQAKIEDSQYAAMQKTTPAQQREQVDLMEQALLADRFKLKVHFETREMPGYALTIAKGGPKLTPAKEGESTRISELGNEMTVRAATLDQWIQSPFLGGRTAVNQTGLKEAYDFTLTWSEQLGTASPGQESGADAPSLFTAVQEQLGLKLVPAKVPVEVIVIDHIERPSEN
jgi:bla regulator protein BlaR1